MKKLLLFIVLTSFSFEVDAQRFISKYEKIRLGFKEGVVTSHITGDAHKGFSKFGMSGGIFARKMIDKSYSVQVELLYTEKGARFRKLYESKADTAGLPGYFLGLQYLEIPLMVQLNYDQWGFPGLTTEIGLSYAFLIKSKEYIHVPGYNIKQEVLPFKKNDATFNLGLTYNMQSNFSLSLRFTRSIIGVREYPENSDIDYTKATEMGGSYLFEKRKKDTPGQQNTALTLSLLYQFILK